MHRDREGAALPPFPLALAFSELARPPAHLALEAGDLRCEMCGAEVIAHHCKRICLKCGFMTGCSEGI